MKLKIKSLKEINDQILSGKIKEYNMHDKINIYEYCKYASAIKKTFNYNYHRNYVEKDYPMDCIFITGPSGVGKSVLSKKIAKNKGYSAYISSISKDILDNYKGQECIILDNIRSYSIDLSDLIVILDNNATHSNIKSRCKHKLFSCELMIINTIKSIDDLFENENEKIYNRLKRRCKFHIKIDSKYITFKVWNPVKMKYDLIEKKPNNLLNEFQIKRLSEKEQKDKIKKVLKIDLDEDS
ncbi:hypothetical protein ['Chrysanthemum coronarium' phytoplasma]|uniref:Replication protein n=2 Tax=16SrI (Aster yellows group) TaxID=3042590 RepID=A0ABQ0J429_9MOLU|nr:hypothetical protein ['Chrysanthemum coronarium' phytoplasma]GAK74365.1 replication protein ['Chrysanthemum coronarium' phytoplasma]